MGTPLLHGIRWTRLKLQLHSNTKSPSPDGHSPLIICVPEQNRTERGARTAVKYISNTTGEGKQKAQDTTAPCALQRSNKITSLCAQLSTRSAASPRLMSISQECLCSFAARLSGIAGLCLAALRPDFQQTDFQRTKNTKEQFTRNL